MVSRVPGKKKTQLDALIESISEGKHSRVLKMVEVLKRRGTLVKELKLEYPEGKEETFIQTTLPKEGKYILWVVARRNGAVYHRFYLKETSKKSVKGHAYHIITMRLPSELRGSNLYIKIFSLE